MKELNLTEPVEVVGRDVFGRPAWIKVTPSDRPGWYYDDGGDNYVPVNLEYAFARKRLRCVSLRGGSGGRANVAEHFTSIRFTGLTDVVVSGSSWPPYHGRPWEVWMALKPKTFATGQTLPLVVPEGSFRFDYRGGKRFVEIGPPYSSNEPNLSVQVTIDYPRFGQHTSSDHLPWQSLDHLEGNFQARTQGWPRWRYNVCRLASLFGWPHLETICWPQRGFAEDVLKEFALHRYCDLLGALALVDHVAVPCGVVRSLCAGHEGDLSLLRSVQFRRFKQS
jgi:hypothetical protein